MAPFTIPFSGVLPCSPLPLPHDALFFDLVEQTICSDPPYSPSISITTWTQLWTRTVRLFGFFGLSCWDTGYWTLSFGLFGRTFSLTWQPLAEIPQQLVPSWILDLLNDFFAESNLTIVPFSDSSTSLAVNSVPTLRGPSSL